MKNVRIYTLPFLINCSPAVLSFSATFALLLSLVPALVALVITYVKHCALRDICVDHLVYDLKHVL